MTATTGHEAFTKDGYWVFEEAHDHGWAWGIGTRLVGDSFPTRDAAVQAAVDEWESQQDEPCDKCGFTAACPECVGC